MCQDISELCMVIYGCTQIPTISGGTTRKVNELIIIASLTISTDVAKYINYDKLCLLCSSVSKPTTSFYIIPQWHALYQSHHSVMAKELRIQWRVSPQRTAICRYSLHPYWFAGIYISLSSKRCTYCAYFGHLRCNESTHFYYVSNYPKKENKCSCE